MTAPQADATGPVARVGRPDGPAPPGFREIFLENFGAMVALARLLGSDDPEDTAQEGFLRLHNRFDGLRDPAAAVGYLRRTVVNLCRNRIRHLMVIRRHHAASDAALPDLEASAESAVIERHRVVAVLTALSRLPERQREAIVLRYWADLPFADIAESMGCPAATARSHVRRGLAGLAPALAQHRAETSLGSGEITTDDGKRS